MHRHEPNSIDTLGVRLSSPFALSPPSLEALLDGPVEPAAARKAFSAMSCRMIAPSSSSGLLCQKLPRNVLAPSRLGK